jgi:hypothetical protein
MIGIIHRFNDNLFIRFFLGVIFFFFIISCSINSKRIKNNSIGGVIDGRFDTIEYIDTTYQIVENSYSKRLKYKIESFNVSLDFYDFILLDNKKWDKSINVIIDKKTGKLVSLKFINPKLSESFRIEIDSTNEYRIK